jgi:hypothetical protein
MPAWRAPEAVGFPQTACLDKMLKASKNQNPGGVGRDQTEERLAHAVIAPILATHKKGHQ